jgi:hypothetical protein
MGILETFSKRKKRLEKQGQADVYQYDELPQPFRIQVHHIWRRSIGPYVHIGEYSSREEPKSNEVWKSLHDLLTNELGKFSLGSNGDYFQRCSEHVLKGTTDDALDIIELSFRIIDTWVRDFSPFDRADSSIEQGSDSAIEELNHRFREHAIGYQYINGEIVRVDSQFIHAEVIKPALSLLNSHGFEGAAEEFLRAHEHYRHERHKEAINEALKAFESTVKTICQLRNWSHPPNATAHTLIQVLMDNGLIPKQLLSEFTAVRTVLESGLPTVRNTSTSSHGQGPSSVSVPGHLVAFALHVAAANIVFIVEAHHDLR